MPSGGKLTVEVRNTSLGKSDRRRQWRAQPGEYVMVAVTDTGTGMPPEVAGRAFEPFFTTKEVGKGPASASAWSTDLPSSPAARCRSAPNRARHGGQLFFPRVARRTSARAPPAAEPRPPAAKPFSWSRTTTWCATCGKASCRTRLSRPRGGERAGGAGYPARARENRPAVHGRRDARRHVRALSWRGSRRAGGPT